MSRLLGKEMTDFLKATNRLNHNIRICNYVDKFHLTEASDDLVGVLRDYVAVIPGQTKFTCRACGTCCLGGRLKLPDEIADRSTGHCKHITPGNKLCPIDDTKPWYCKTFPFNYAQITTTLKLLFVSYNCAGYNTGEVIDDMRYLRILGRTEHQMQTRDI